MAMGVEDVGDLQTLGDRSFDHGFGGVGGVDEKTGARFAVADEVAEVAVSAGPDLFEDEAHGQAFVAK
jgi:hypothetical protein